MSDRKAGSRRSRGDSGSDSEPDALTGDTTHLRNASQEVWDRMRNEQGVQQRDIGGGRTAYITRRGSVMLHSNERDGRSHAIAIAHSRRTSHMLSQMETFDREHPENTERARGYEPSRRYSSPVFPAAQGQGHIAEVARFSGTAKEGFRELGSGRYASGKAGGKFGRQTMQRVTRAGWPEGRVDDTHHSETKYADEQLANPTRVPTEGVVFHRMEGANDMCGNCQTGTSNAVAPEGSGHIVAYTGERPFRSLGEWGKAGVSVFGPGHIVRNRPEEIMGDPDRQDHEQRAATMLRLRNPQPEVRAFKHLPVGSSKSAGSGPKKPPGAGGAGGAGASGVAGGGASSRSSRVQVRG